MVFGRWGPEASDEAVPTMMMKNLSAILSVVLGIGCIGAFVRNHGAESPERIASAPQPALDSTAQPKGPRSADRIPMSVTETAAVDTSLPTGSIDRGTALRAPNPAAYADAAKNGSSLVLTGAEAVNYLAGNTLRREGPDEPLHFTYFASRGLQGEGSERGFVVRAWNRNGSDLCDTGPDRAVACRSITILLDGKSELAGGKLGTVTIGGNATAVLIKGNILRFPEHIPFLDSEVGARADAGQVAAAAIGKGPVAWNGIVGHAASVSGEAADAARHVVYYARDNRLLDLEPIAGGPGRGVAVKVTVGHWRTSKALLCQTRVIGDAAQTCFKPEGAADGSVRLVPAGKGGEAQVVNVLAESGARTVAQD